MRVGDVIAELEEGPVAANEAPAASAASTRSDPPKAPPAPASGGAAGPASEAHVMPAAARLLAEHGLEASAVTATGPGGRLLKEDVERHVAGETPPAAARVARGRKSRSARHRGAGTRRTGARAMKPPAKFRSGRALASLVLALLVLPALAAPSRLAPERALDLDLPESVALPDGDLLAPFDLVLGGAPDGIEARPLSREGRYLSAGDDSYLHVALRPRSAEEYDVLPAPEGLSVVDADLYYAGGERLTEASLLVMTRIGKKSAIDRLIALLGAPEFAINLPGNTDLAIGWRRGRGYLLASFTDLPIFKISAFEDRPDDLLAGSSIVLYEGLSIYATRVEAGEPPADCAAELREIVDWVGMARDTLRPRR